jgi:Spy/CpxP family protein refolding chaperone
MNAAKMLSLAVEAAREIGYEVREEVLEGAGGGHCTIHGKKCLLLDMTQTHREQLNDVVDALRAENFDAAKLHPLIAASLQAPVPKAA